MCQTHILPPRLEFRHTQGPYPSHSILDVLNAPETKFRESEIVKRLCQANKLGSLRFSARVETGCTCMMLLVDTHIPTCAHTCPMYTNVTPCVHTYAPTLCALVCFQACTIAFNRAFFVLKLAAASTSTRHRQRPPTITDCMLSMIRMEALVYLSIYLCGCLSIHLSFYLSIYRLLHFFFSNVPNNNPASSSERACDHRREGAFLRDERHWGVQFSPQHSSSKMRAMHRHTLGSHATTHPRMGILYGCTLLFLAVEGVCASVPIHVFEEAMCS